ncbi:hypothetical protein [Streptomyces fragilis]|uniref:hypothetical protein n=1 Tax=Streptomyces fragilis TaxID=67301 RepID=UPI0024DE4500|nr:hypothetical protein [Streptomyces fragilis]
MRTRPSSSTAAPTRSAPVSYTHLRDGPRTEGGQDQAHLRLSLIHIYEMDLGQREDKTKLIYGCLLYTSRCV